MRWMVGWKNAHIRVSLQKQRSRSPPARLVSSKTFVSFRSCIITHPLAGFTGGGGGAGVLVFASDFFLFFVKFYCKCGLLVVFIIVYSK